MGLGPRCAQAALVPALPKQPGDLSRATSQSGVTTQGARLALLQGVTGYELGWVVEGTH